MNMRGMKGGFAILIGKLLRAAAGSGLKVRQTSGVRSFLRQAMLYNAYVKDPKMAREKYGVVSKPAPMGRSNHNPDASGLASAVDLKASWIDAENHAGEDAQDKLGELATSIKGLTWGGTWRHKDRVHFQESDMDMARRYEQIGARIDRENGIMQ